MSHTVTVDAGPGQPRNVGWQLPAIGAVSGVVVGAIITGIVCWVVHVRRRDKPRFVQLTDVDIWAR
jgi:hypothetical protein